jgi:hypothetical protein
MRKVILAALAVLSFQASANNGAPGGTGPGAFGGAGGDNQGGIQQQSAIGLGGAGGNARIGSVTGGAVNLSQSPNAMGGSVVWQQPNTGYSPSIFIGGANPSTCRANVAGIGAGAGDGAAASFGVSWTGEEWYCVVKHFILPIINETINDPNTNDWDRGMLVELRWKYIRSLPRFAEFQREITSNREELSKVRFTTLARGNFTPPKPPIRKPGHKRVAAKR